MNHFAYLSVLRSSWVPLSLIAALAGCAGGALDGEWRQPSRPREDASAHPGHEESADSDDAVSERDGADLRSDAGDAGPRDAALEACDACMRDE